MKKRVHKVIKFYLILILFVLLIIFIPKAYRQIKVKATSKIVDEVLINNSYIKDLTGKEIHFGEIYQELDQEEREKVNSLIDEYANTDTISDVTEMVRDGVTKEEAYEYIEENVDPEDIEYLMELYQKHVE